MYADPFVSGSSVAARTYAAAILPIGVKGIPARRTFAAIGTMSVSDLCFQFGHRISINIRIERRGLKNVPAKNGQTIATRSP